MDTNQIVILVGGLVMLLVLTVLPQWRARKRREQQREELVVGAQIMTVGGIVGRVTGIDAEADRVQLEVAPGVEISVITAAIGRSLDEPTEAVAEPADEGEAE